MSDNENVDTSETVCQSSNYPTPNENCCVYYSSDEKSLPDCNKEFQADCPDGVCSIPKKDGESLKRKMKSPNEAAADVSSSEISQFDQLFSHLFSSVLQSSNANEKNNSEKSNSDENNSKKSEKNNSEKKSKKSKKSKREGSESQSDSESEESNKEENESDESQSYESDTEYECDKYEEEEDGCNDTDETDCSVHGVDHRWEVINKLLESHLNITRTVSDFLNT